MDAKGRLILLSFLFSICYFYGIYTFIIGFMPIKVSKSGTASIENLPEEPRLEGTEVFKIIRESTLDIYKRRYNKLILMLIDGFRADFLSATKSHSLFFNQTPFKYIDGLMKNGTAIYFPVRTNSPTITLPRLKTLTTGGLSSFSDILMNYNAPELKDDSIVHQIYSRNDRIVFYGDDTWINLFPKEFYRYEGTHSFFVSDYEEVDNNVTRHLDNELLRDDWDVLILHYLGVDHIGHSKGPHSALMPVKLREMDSIIQNLHIKSQERSGDLPDLIVVCGDHGMTDSGSHGGNTDSETTVPLVFINTKEWNYFIHDFSKSVSQLDITPTLCALLGLPIPANSIGVMIPEILHASGMSPREILYTMYYNLFQLLDSLNYNNEKEPIDLNSIKKIVTHHQKWLNTSTQKNSEETDLSYANLLHSYSSKLSEIQETLVQNSISYDDKLMCMGIIIISVSTLLQFCNVVSFWKLRNCFDIFNYRTMTIGKGVLIFNGCVVIINFHLWNAAASICLGILIIGTVVFCIEFGHLSYKNIFVCPEEKQSLLLILPILSLTSSSFIEEEHQVWYFLSQTIISLSFLQSALLFLEQHFISKVNYLYPLKAEYLCKKPNLLFALQSNEKKNIKHDKYQHVCSLLLLFVSRLLRSWNQTGNKWLNLTDISDWLVENPLISNVLILFSEIGIFLLMKKTLNIVPYVLLFLSLCCIYVQKFHIGSSKWFNDRYLTLCPHFIYLVVLFFVILGMKKRFVNYPKKYFKSNASELAKVLVLLAIGWILLAIVLARPQNIPILAGILLQEYLLNEITWKHNTGIVLNVISYLIMAMCSFFYLGNSNSISTLDVVAGYIGLTSYQPYIVGFLIICNTYSGIVLWFLMIFYRIYNLYKVQIFSDEMRENTLRHVVLCCLGIILYRFIMLAMYVVLLYYFRYHLFIWSVFAPKFLYEIAHTVLFFILSSVILSVVM